MIPAVDEVVKASRRVVATINLSKKRDLSRLSLRASVTSGGVTATDTPHGVRVCIASGAEFWLKHADAADLAKALNALPEVAHGWRGSVR